MQGGRGGRNPFVGFGDAFGNFGDPFGGFGGFDGGFGDHRSLMPSFFGGRNPFDDPFFTRPFGGMFESGFFGSNGSSFAPMPPSPFMQYQSLEPPMRSRGPIIEELNSDDEKETTDNSKKENPRKHGRPSKEPFVEDPDDGVKERKSKHIQYRNSHNQFNAAQHQPQTQSFSFQSSTVTYGGANGAYYSSSTTRRAGSDGVTVEESKEADTSTREATHRISRGLYNKGHTFTRKLNSDGKVDAKQTLHNLHEGELAGFEEAWKGKAKQSLPGWTGNLGGHDNIGAAIGGGQASQRGWALPSTGHKQQTRTAVPDYGQERLAFPQVQHARRTKGTSNVKDKSGYSRGEARD